MAKFLETGASGFVGRHLTRELAERGDEVVGLVRREGSLAGEPATEVVADLTDAAATAEAVAAVKPDGIFHLAAPETSVAGSWNDREGTKRGNVETARHLLEAALALDPPPRVLVVSSSEVYGKSKKEEQPVNEDSPQRPDSPYAESKQTVEELALEFAAQGLPVIIARPFNHIGPGQSDRFAVPNFAKQIAAIEQTGKAGVVEHGNLEAERDFGDVRDIVKAYVILMEHGQPGEVYNIGPGQARSVQKLLDMLVAESTAKIDLVADPDRYRPNDVPMIESDSSKIMELGWQPRIPIEQTIKDILEDARERVK